MGNFRNLTDEFFRWIVFGRIAVDRWIMLYECLKKLDRYQKQNLGG